MAAAAAAPAQQPGTDWSGLYIGGSYGRTSDSDAQSQGGAVRAGIDYGDSGPGIFAGYNLQRDALVYGAELALVPGTADDPGSHFGTRNHRIDLKGRIGYVLGKALVYGVIGWSGATTVESPGNVDIPTEGLSYGIGVDYQATGRFFLGLEYLQRDLDGDYARSGFPGWTFDSTSRSVSLRAGLRF